MRRLLVCTIVRDALPHLDTWWHQLAELTKLVAGEYDVTLSVAENDSVDGSAGWLRLQYDRWGDWHANWGPLLDGFHLSTQTLGTQRYPSIWSVDRLRNLATARQQCLDQVPDLAAFDKVAYVEVDCTWDARWCQELVLARHPLAAGLGEPDIYSGWSLRPLSNPKESVFLYDTCATRATKDDTCWDVTEQCGRWRGATVIPTDLGGPDSMCLHPVWSTFSCFCVYNAEPFKRGVRWDYLNPRLDTGQPRYGRAGPDLQQHIEGWLDSDTSVLCEAFRARGYDKVYLNTNCLVRHS